MKRTILMFLIAASIAFAAPTLAASKAQSGITGNDTLWIGSYGRLHNWRAVSQNELILWESPSRPYLVTIARPFLSLRHAHTIGVTTTVGRVSKFEHVIVRGQRLPIKSIVAIDRETAKSMRWVKERG